MHHLDLPGPFIGLLLPLCAAAAARSHHLVTDTADTFTFPPSIGYLTAFFGLCFCAMPFLPVIVWRQLFLPACCLTRLGYQVGRWECYRIDFDLHFFFHGVSHAQSAANAPEAVGFSAAEEKSIA